jgi:hypothetical protein
LECFRGRSDVTIFLSKTFEQVVLDQHLNTWLQSLIPKPNLIIGINDYKPIFVFTSTYKIAIEVLAFHLQPLFLNYIIATQTWFVKKKHILDNVFLATKAM